MTRPNGANDILPNNVVVILELDLNHPMFEGRGYIQYAPLQNVMRSTTMEVVIKLNGQSDGLILYSGENKFGSGDYIALLIRNR